MNSCNKYKYYSKQRAIGILTKLDRFCLFKLRSNKVPFCDSWKPSSSQSKKLKSILKHKLYDTFKKLKLPFLSFGVYFEEYLDIQLSYLIFEIIIQTFLDSKQQKSIIDIPLLNIPINSVYYYVPKYNKYTIDLVQKKFYQVKGKYINFNNKISISDKLVLDLKLEQLLEDIFTNINLGIFIEKIYNEYIKKKYIKNEYIAENPVKDNNELSDPIYGSLSLYPEFNYQL